MVLSMISCRDLVEFLDDYLSGELPAAQREEFDQHLSMCPSCVAYMRTYQQAIRLGKAVLRGGDEPLPPGVPEALVGAILSSRRKH